MAPEVPFEQQGTASTEGEWPIQKILLANAFLPSLIGLLPRLSLSHPSITKRMPHLLRSNFIAKEWRSD